MSVHFAATLQAKDLFAHSPQTRAQDHEYSNLTTTHAPVGYLIWKVKIPEAGKYRLHVHFTSQDNRPCALTINEVRQSDPIVGERTGTWFEGTLKWFSYGPYDFVQGENQLRLDFSGYQPHIKEFGFELVELAIPKPMNYWSFNQAGTPTAADLAGNQTATIDRQHLVAGKFGTALRFAEDQGARVVTIPGPDRPPPWTAALWVKREKATYGSALLSSHHGAIKLEQWPGNLGVGITRFGTADWTTGKEIPLNEWTHLAVATTPGETRFYINGALVSTLPHAIDLPRAYLGSTNGYVEFAEACLDDVRLYAEALSAGQIAHLAKLTP